MDVGLQFGFTFKLGFDGFGVGVGLGLGFGFGLGFNAFRSNVGLCLNALGLGFQLDLIGSEFGWFSCTWI